MSEAWAATVLTLFPEMFPGPLGLSLAGRALASGVWRLDAVDIRDFATDRHRTVDGTPSGGESDRPHLRLRTLRKSAALPGSCPAGTWSHQRGHSP